MRVHPRGWFTGSIPLLFAALIAGGCANEPPDGSDFPVPAAVPDADASPLQGGTTEQEDSGWWVSPWPLPDHDYAAAKRLSVGPCPKGDFVQKTEWEDSSLSVASWIEQDAIDPDSLADYPPPPAVDEWAVKVDNPSDLPFFDASRLPLPDGAWVGVHCAEVSPGSFGLLGDDYFMVGAAGS